MNRLILADNQAIFRAGAARVLALEGDIRIVAQCDDLARLTSAIDAARGAVILVSTTLRPDLAALTTQAHALDSRVILIAENAEHISDSIAALLDGIMDEELPRFTEALKRLGESLCHACSAAGSPEAAGAGSG